MTTESRPRVVILGAGFGGLWASRARNKHPVEVLLLDRNNYHTFLPLLYQVAAAELEPEDIAQPVRSLLRRTPNVAFMLADVQGIDFATRQVQTTERAIPYDFLILAVGSTSHYFGVPGAAEHAFPLRTLEQGIALRNQILCCFERAMHETNIQRRQRLLTFVIVGGGPTGVEFAGSLIELVAAPWHATIPPSTSKRCGWSCWKPRTGCSPRCPNACLPTPWCVCARWASRLCWGPRSARWRQKLCNSAMMPSYLRRQWSGRLGCVAQH